MRRNGGLCVDHFAGAAARNAIAATMAGKAQPHDLLTGVPVLAYATRSASGNKWQMNPHSRHPAVRSRPGKVTDVGFNIGAYRSAVVGLGARVPDERGHVPGAAGLDGPGRVSRDHAGATPAPHHRRLRGGNARTHDLCAARGDLHHPAVGRCPRECLGAGHSRARPLALALAVRRAVFVLADFERRTIHRSWAGALPLRSSLLAFFLARSIFNTVMVLAAGPVASNVSELFTGRFGWGSLLVVVGAVAAYVLFLKLPWARWLGVTRAGS
jgi:hypothetical protein